MIKLKHFTNHAKDVLCKRVVQAVERWQKDWCFEAGGITTTVSPISSKQQGLHYFIDQDNADFFLSVQQEPSRWDALIFGAYSADAPEDNIRASLVAAAQNAFFSSVTGAITGQSRPATLRQVFEPIETREIVSIHCLGAQLLNLQITVNDETFQLHFPFSFVNGIEAKQETLKVPLQKLAARDIDQALVAKVNLKFGDHSLSDINNLDVGDILLSTTPMHTLFSVSINGTSIAEAHLGRDGDKKAIKLVKPGNKL